MPFTKLLLSLLAGVGAVAGTATVLLSSAETPTDPTQLAADAADLAALHRNTISENLGRPLLSEVGIVIGDDPHAGSGGLGCVITIPTGAIEDLSNLVANQVFRCFQHEIEPEPEDSWLSSGMPEFFDDLIAGPSTANRTHHERFVCEPQAALWSRNETSVGFFAAIDALGGDPWALVDPMTRRSGLDSVAASGFEPADLVERMATMIALDAGFGPEWSYDAIGRPDRSCLVEVFVEPGSPLSSTEHVSDMATIRPLAITARGEVVSVRVEAEAGAIAVDQGTHTSIRGATEMLFCVDVAPCECPSGATIGSHIGESTIAVAGGRVSAGSIEVEAELSPTEEHCADGPFLELHYDGISLVLTGGLCFIDEAGMLNGAFGYVPSWDAREQPDPYPFAQVGLLSAAIDGTRDGASLFLSLDGSSTRQVSPTFDIDTSLTTGQFSGAGATGRFECGEFVDPSRPVVGG